MEGFLNRLADNHTVRVCSEGSQSLVLGHCGCYCASVWPEFLDSAVVLFIDWRLFNDDNPCLEGANMGSHAAEEAYIPESLPCAHFCLHMGMRWP